MGSGATGSTVCRDGGADSVRSGTDDRPVMIGKRGVDADEGSLDLSEPSVASSFPIAWKSNPARVGIGACISPCSGGTVTLGSTGVVEEGREM